MYTSKLLVSASSDSWLKYLKYRCSSQQAWCLAADHRITIVYQIPGTWYGKFNELSVKLKTQSSKCFLNTRLVTWSFGKLKSATRRLNEE